MKAHKRFYKNPSIKEDDEKGRFDDHVTSTVAWDNVHHASKGGGIMIRLFGDGGELQMRMSAGEALALAGEIVAMAARRLT